MCSTRVVAVPKDNGSLSIVLVDSVAGRGGRRRTMDQRVRWCSVEEGEEAKRAGTD